MADINKTQLNKLRAQIEKNKLFLDKIPSIKSEDVKYSLALSMSVLMEHLKLNQNRSYECLTDGQLDSKFDAIYYSDDEDELSELVVIQSKYKQKDGDTKTFDEDEIKICIDNCEKILRGEEFLDANEKVKQILSDYRKLLSDNGNPSISIKLIFATNGTIHSDHKLLKEISDVAKKGIHVSFVDAGFFSISPVLENGEIKINIKDEKDRTDSIFNINDPLYSGTVVSCTLEDLMIFYKESGEKYLLNNNVRYLLKSSHINKQIRESFLSDPVRFCYLNNGISITCESYEFSLTGTKDFGRLKLNGPNIVNGGQTISVLYELYCIADQKILDLFKQANILIRIYKVPDDFKIKIAQATNSQNPINVVDLKSNDSSQKKVKDYFEKEGIGFICKDGEDVTYYDDTVTNESILQVYASLFKDDPAKSKLSKSWIFKTYYPEVFVENIDDTTFKKLFRCYEVSKYVYETKDQDKTLISNAFYSIIYAMKKINPELLNIDIHSKELVKYLNPSFTKAVGIIQSIVIQKQAELGTRFSQNNLFKGSDIKVLIDLALEKSIK